MAIVFTKADKRPFARRSVIVDIQLVLMFRGRASVLYDLESSALPCRGSLIPDGFIEKIMWCGKLIPPARDVQKIKKERKKKQQKEYGSGGIRTHMQRCEKQR